MLVLYALTNQMPGHEVALLNARRRVTRGAKAGVAELRHFASGSPCEANRAGAYLAGSPQGFEDVDRITAGRDADDDVVCPHRRPNLPGKDLRKVIVIANRGQDRRVAG